jgi:polyribonucleotide 5'-hydroxyl-kinase
MASDVPTLGWWYGHLEPTTKGVDVWKKLVSNMAQRFADRCARDPTGELVKIWTELKM